MTPTKQTVENKRSVEPDHSGSESEIAKGSGIKWRISKCLKSSTGKKGNVFVEVSGTSSDESRHKAVQFPAKRKKTSLKGDAVLRSKSDLDRKVRLSAAETSKLFCRGVNKCIFKFFFKV